MLKRGCLFGIFFGTILLLGSPYHEARIQVRQFIKNNYGDDCEILKDFDAICNSAKSDDEKINLLHQKFPEVFRVENLIFLPAISYRVHSLQVGYFIKEDIHSKVVYKDIVKELQTKSEEIQQGKKDQLISSHDLTFRAELGVDGEASVDINPLTWRFSVDTKINLQTAYNYHRNAKHEKEIIWSERDQALFSANREQLEEITRDKRLTGFHIAFVVSIQNNTDRTLIVDLNSAQIPVHIGETSFAEKALKGEGEPDFVSLEPNDTKEITFCLQLGTTHAIGLLQSMTKHSPEFPLERGTLKIYSKDGTIQSVWPDVSCKEPCEVVEIVTPDQTCMGWNIRKRYNTSAVILRDGLDAINQKWLAAGMDDPLFQYDEGGNLSQISGIPFGDVNGKHEIALLEHNHKIISAISKSELEKKLRDGKYSFYLIPLDYWVSHVESYPDALSEKICAILEKKDDPYCQYIAGSYLVQNTSDVERLNKAFRLFEKSDSHDYGKGTALLARCCYLGKGTPKNDKKAFELLQKAARQGGLDAQSQCLLGEFFINGIGCRPDFAAGVEWLEKSFGKGNVDAALLLGGFYFTGFGGKPNYEEAEKWFQKAAEKGNPDAMVWMGRCGLLRQGEEKEAVEYFQKAADLGNNEGEFLLGIACALDIGTLKNEKKAFELLRKAAEQNNLNAQECLAFCYFAGIGRKPDFSAFLKSFTKLPERFDDEHIFCLGRAYAERNHFKEAVQCFQINVRRGYADGQCWLGRCYLEGKGVEKDETKAVELFRLAVKQGSADGQGALGVCYFQGKGVEKDEKEAVRLFQLAAEQGSADGQVALGYCYLTGKGVEKDEKETVRLFRSAAEQGNLEARKLLSQYEEWRSENKESEESDCWKDVAGIIATEIGIYGLTLLILL